MVESSRSEENTSGRPIEWNRIAALVATIAVLFFFTRSAPFPASTYWDLALARDFDLQIGWVMLPETLALSIADSTASLLGLKAVYHIAFFAVLLNLHLGFQEPRNNARCLAARNFFAVNAVIFKFKNAAATDFYRRHPDHSR